MRSVSQATVSLFTVIVLAGSPAVAAACAALCGPEANHARHGQAAVAIEVAAPAASADSAAHHHHHGDHREVETEASAEPEAPPADGTSVDGDCCAHDDQSLTLLAAAVRFELDMADAAAQRAIRHLDVLRPVSSGTFAGDPSPPLVVAPQTPLVLRI